MRFPHLFVLALLPICAACATAPPICKDPASPMARLELLFGADRAGGTPVGEAEWSLFLDSEVTPRFPDGLTVLDGAGQWRSGGGGILRERSRLLLIWYRPTARSEADIEAIRAAYKQRFAQESVLRADGVSCVSF